MHHLIPFRSLQDHANEMVLNLGSDHEDDIKKRLSACVTPTTVTKMTTAIMLSKSCRNNCLTRFLHSLPTPNVVAEHRPPNDLEIKSLENFIKVSKNLVCITGAGVSTSSGLPDYRGINGSYKRGHKPMVHSDFVNELSSRQRYWSRSMIGWERVSQSHPNDSHIALSSFESKHKLSLLITQNVDRLHQKAKSKNVVDLHGRIDEVLCLQCRDITTREAYQHTLLESNPEYGQFMQQFAARAAAPSLARADGDVDLGECRECLWTMFKILLLIGSVSLLLSWL